MRKKDKPSSRIEIWKAKSFVKKKKKMHPGNIRWSLVADFICKARKFELYSISHEDFM